MSYEARESNGDQAARPRHARRLRLTANSPSDGHEITTEYLEHTLEPSLMRHQAYWHSLFTESAPDLAPPIVRLVLFKDHRIMWARGASTFEQSAWDKLASGRTHTAHVETQLHARSDGSNILYAHVVTDVRTDPESQELLIPESTYNLIDLVGATTNQADDLFLVIDGVHPNHDENIVPRRLFAGNLEAYFISDRPRSFSSSLADQ